MIISCCAALMGETENNESSRRRKPKKPLAAWLLGLSGAAISAVVVAWAVWLFGPNDKDKPKDQPYVRKISLNEEELRAIDASIDPTGSKRNNASYQLVRGAAIQLFLQKRIVEGGDTRIAYEFEDPITNEPVRATVSEQFRVGDVWCRRLTLEPRVGGRWRDPRSSTWRLIGERWQQDFERVE